MAACGSKSRSGSENNSDSTAARNNCINENNLQLQIIKPGKNETGVFETSGTFDVLESQLKIMTDSMVEFCFKNHRGDIRERDDMDLLITLCSSSGKTIKPATYSYMAFDSDYYSKVRIETVEGSAWFNWDSTIPHPGAVTICHISDKYFTGSVHLTVNKPENPSIGVVKLNGNFTIGINR